MQVPHLAERDAELEQAEVVDRQERVPARVAVLAEQPFDRVVVGHQRRDLRLGDPLEQRLVPGVEVAARREDLRRVRVAVPLQDLGGEPGVQQEHVARLDDDVVGRHDLLERLQVDAPPVVAEVVGQVDEHASPLHARRRPCARGRGGGRSSGGCRRPRRRRAAVRRGRPRRGSRCSTRPPRPRRRRRRTRHRRGRASPTASSTAARGSRHRRPRRRRTWRRPSPPSRSCGRCRRWPGVPSMSSVGARAGGCRRWFKAVPPGKSSGRLRQKLMPASTSRTPCRTFSGVSRLMRPSSSSSPQSPHVEPGGRCCHRFVTSRLPSLSTVPTGWSSVRRAGSHHRRKAQQ